MHMKRSTYAIIFVIAVCFGILLLTRLPEQLIAILVFGIIPNSDLNVPNWIPFLLYPFVFLIVLTWLSRQTLYIGETVKPVSRTTRTKSTKSTKSTKKRSLTAKKATTKRRPVISTPV